MTGKDKGKWTNSNYRRLDKMTVFYSHIILFYEKVKLGC